MGRCNECVACIVVHEARQKYAGTSKKNKNKVKFAERHNKCENPTSTNKKRRINELENLRSAGHGSRIRREVDPPPSLTELQMDPADRAARPGDLIEAPISNDAEHDEYLRIVLQCTQTAEASLSEDVRVEARSMIPKMKGLLVPKLRAEVDFTEALKDCSHIHYKWLNNEAAGTRAFIPDINDRDDCYSALRIYSCALEESKLIPTEYVDVWGEEGYWIYKTMLDNIGERDKRSLPFVNMCLRSWMLRLLEDGDLWPEMDSLDYDVWLAKEVHNTGEDNQPGKTSFQLMMATFGNCKPTAAGKSNAPTAKISMAKGSVNTSTCPTAQMSITKAPVKSLARKAGPARISKLQQLGGDLRKKILISSELRTRYLRRKQADEALLELVPDTVVSEHTKAVKEACRRAAQRMEDLLFTTGGADRLLLTLKYFCDRPAIRELTVLKELSNNVVSDNGCDKYMTKAEKLNSFIATNLKGFLQFFSRPRGEKDTGGGRRSNEDQNAYDVVMTAVMNNDLTKAKLGRAFAREMQVSHRAVTRGRGMRKEMEDMDSKRWIRQPSRVPKNAIGVGEFANLCPHSVLYCVVLYCVRIVLH